MSLFNVYPIYSVTPVKASGCTVWDEKGDAYLDFYGGHGVISIGHSHPTYIKHVTEQINSIGFYSNSIINPVQEKLGNLLPQICGYPDYSLFLCNSGAEANENALKLASFHTGKSKVLAFKNSFHGRTSAAVAVTDNPKIIAPINAQQEVVFCELNDIKSVKKEIAKGEVSSVIIEAIQGVGGLDEGSTEFFRELEKVCKNNKVVLILDEIQCGYGRSGKFFAHQHHGIKADIISVAKGMGNGFPIGGILISPEFTSSFGLLGTTFGGNHLACAAALAVLEVMEDEEILNNVQKQYEYFIKKFSSLSQIKKIKGKGLMLGLEFDFEVADLRKKLIYEKKIFTGNSNNKNLLRVLPPLTISKNEIDMLYDSLQSCL
ncbi:aminotransferase class III-fold pyridoxal phosphate-dependent enzyme [Apibacter sp. B3889]|uniref:aspartate aminotransferase family protein n=1 Tax=unclassified Apibacter TaxID=2630820 RepID=UPI001322DE7F|nr:MULTISPECIES: aminotransferase class III-fold pyridoxal phosphate-dependent enzyme [unclassified Apibacter]MXO34774.1 aminotransferase class III-fold pyridoxal phosphate-dependent enzyme [Apibacter sp. B3883]MXO42122.1 aminotransferase class III-fold pyridoxal phosphate-dependent enzyme [Apibacter sp. B3889]MXP03692.1 aminotransferase class III-fold pyridoxal phosphate-dependent enzyme [Apibacter sp. B3887]MXP08072.1 aminotransferase class III-fold pyridoxal phosphate-dependent enzyme [Apiba